jgi:indole-3-glycerol phosphate synthase
MTSLVTSDLLASIISATRMSKSIREKQRSIEGLESLAASRSPKGKMFWERLSRTETINVIAECKRRSPSKGLLTTSYDPVSLATEYENFGAAAVSVLTEPTFFDGSIEHLRAVSASVDIPVLCKDFIISEYQVLEACIAGADAVLLIVAALDQQLLLQLLRRVESLGMAALVEVHDLGELERAVRADASIVGVNNRNLRTLEIAVETSKNLISHVPNTIVSIAESGLADQASVLALRDTGYKGFLIGEALMSSESPGLALSEFVQGTT